LKVALGRQQLFVGRIAFEQLLDHAEALVATRALRGSVCGSPVQDVRAQRRHEAAAPLPPKCSVCGGREVELWLFVKRDEAAVGEGDAALIQYV
jgi:hypothetical protein